MFEGKDHIIKMSQKHTATATLRMVDGDNSLEGFQFLPCSPRRCVLFRRTYKLQDVFYYMVNFNEENVEDSFIRYGLSVPVVVDTAHNEKRINLKDVVLNPNQVYGVHHQQVMIFSSGLHTHI